MGRKAIDAFPRMKGLGNARLHPLDYDGRRSGFSRPVRSGRISIDGRGEETPYCELERF